MRSGLGAGFRSCECWGLPRRQRPPTEEENTLRLLPLAGAVVYDVGANIGVFSLFFSRQVGASGQVVAFEPAAANFAKLMRNLRLNRVSNVLPMALGLGAAAATCAAYAIGGSGGTMTMMQSESPDPRYVRAGTMRVEPLDAVAAEHALPKPDFIKLDVEGAELDVIEGARGVLRSSRPRLFIELHGHGAGDKSRGGECLATMLDELGYAMVHVETAARVSPRGFVPGVGHLLCSPV